MTEFGNDEFAKFLRKRFAGHVGRRADGTASPSVHVAQPFEIARKPRQAPQLKA